MSTLPQQVKHGGQVAEPWLDRKENESEQKTSKIHQEQDRIAVKKSKQLQNFCSSETKHPLPMSCEPTEKKIFWIGWLC